MKGKLQTLGIQTKRFGWRLGGLGSAAATCTCQNRVLQMAECTEDRTWSPETKQTVRREVSGEGHEYTQVCASRFECRIQNSAGKASK